MTWGRYLRIRLRTRRKQAHRCSLKRQLQQRRKQVKKYLRRQKIDLVRREGGDREAEERQSYWRYLGECDRDDGGGGQGQGGQVTQPGADA